MEPGRHSGQELDQPARTRPARKHPCPLVDLWTVEEPVVMNEGDRRQSTSPDTLEQAERHAAHRPPRDDVRPKLAHVAAQDAVVVALQRQPLVPPQTWPGVVMPVPAKLTKHVFKLGLGGPG